jgi:hypothetical protein
MTPHPISRDIVIMLTVHCEGMLTGHGAELSSAAIVGEDKLLPVDYSALRVSDRLLLEYQAATGHCVTEIKP